MIAPIFIDPNALYNDGALRQALGLSPTCLAAGRRSGSLRYTRKGKRIFYRGNWVLAWIDPTTEPRPETNESRDRADGWEVAR